MTTTTFQHTNRPLARAELTKVICEALVADAVDIDRLLAEIERITAMDLPGLGLATTRELLAELEGRAVMHPLLGSARLDYRTLGDETHADDGTCWCRPLVLTEKS